MKAVGSTRSARTRPSAAGTSTYPPGAAHDRTPASAGRPGGRPAGRRTPAAAGRARTRAGPRLPRTPPLPPAADLDLGGPDRGRGRGPRRLTRPPPPRRPARRHPPQDDMTIATRPAPADAHQIARLLRAARALPV